MGLLPEIFSTPLAKAGTLADRGRTPDVTEFKNFRKLLRKKRKQVSRQSGRTPKK